MNKQLAQWQFKDVDPGAANRSDLAIGRGDGWMAISAPGDTYLALVEAKRLDHPFIARNETNAEWIRHREWWWHTRVAIDAVAEREKAELVFDGLDTFADIYVDGNRIAASNNMFTQLRVDVTDLAGSGERNVAVCFHPVATRIDLRILPTWGTFSIFNDEGRALVRKAQYGWGWDWGPNLPTVGIWKPVRIERVTRAMISSLDFTTLSVSGDTAQVRADLTLTGQDRVDVELLDPDGRVAARGSREGTGSLDLEIAAARLWWTADLGEQPLYTLTARTAGGERSRRVGIRTIDLDQSPDPEEPGATFFRFILNGVPIFAKGACWIPASSFIGAVPPDTYRDYVARAVSANMNMLRIWGGGIYEDDGFYDACDTAGVLVWQDFMFACAPYPEDDDFLANVRTEIAGQVRRLRSHPCLALWCGNNEIQLLQAFDNHVRKVDERLVGLSIFEELIPEILNELDPVTPYWPSSPWGKGNPNSMRTGDVHDWTVWHGAAPVRDEMPKGPLMSLHPEGIHFTRYAEDEARFVSEFGIHGSPALATLRRWMASEDMTLDSPGFKERNKDRGNKASDMASLTTGRPRTIAEYVDFTMLLQAEGLKFGIEHFRRRKPHCSGALIWQFNDCWPCVSWSLIDYDGVAKASYFAVRAAYAPVLASLRYVDYGTAELWITNDRTTQIADMASLTLMSFDGRQDWRTDVPFIVEGNQSVMIWRGEIGARVNHVLTVRAPSGLFPDNRLLPAPVKDLALPSDPGLTWRVVGARVSVTAAQYALSVYVDARDDSVRFDDNYFDLAAGETRTIFADRPMAAAVEVSSWADRRAAHDRALTAEVAA